MIPSYVHFNIFLIFKIDIQFYSLLLNKITSDNSEHLQWLSLYHENDKKKSTIIVLEAQSVRFLGKSGNLFHLL